MTRAFFLFFISCGLCLAVDVDLRIPDPFFSGVAMRGELVVTNAKESIERIELPTVKGVQFSNIRGTSSQITNINGISTQTDTFAFAIKVSEENEVVIPPIVVHFTDGSTARSQSKTITPELPNTNLKGEAFAEAFFDPPSIVPGQPATLVYRVYLNQDRLRVCQEPDLTPPAKLLTLGERSEATSQTVDDNGQMWTVQTWRWPVTASLADTYTATGQQEWYRCRESFGRLRPISKSQVAIKPGTLTVSPLPEAGRPADFAGLIGPLTAEARVDRTRIATGEGTVFSITLRGAQVALAHRPALNLSANAQAYPKDDNSDNGERTFTWDIVPNAVGSINIPAIGFPYFDPQEKIYQRTTTDPISVEVLPGRQRNLVISGNIEPKTVLTEPQTVTLPPPIRGQTAIRPPQHVWWIVVVSGLMLGSIAALSWRWIERPRRGPHRGKQLRKALQSNDLDAISQALFALRPALNQEQRNIADDIERDIDAARFGGAAPTQLAERAAPLVEIA